MARTANIDMCNGPLMPALIRFSLPLMASGILQLLYNAADIIVVGQYTDTGSLAAITSTSSLINLITNASLGLSVGVVAIVAQNYGAKNREEVQKNVHTALLLSLICSGIVMALGLTFSGTFLRWMGSPAEVQPLATLYTRIYFLGTPGSLVYNFGAGIMRAAGNTKQPLIYLTVAGVINIILNLVTVIGFGMGVAGVAIATITSQYISAFFVVRFLYRTTDSIRFSFSKLRLDRRSVSRILLVGIPVGIQSSLFSFSNVLMQSSVNSFGKTVIAGSGASSNIEGFIFAAMDAVHQAALSFSGQNLGARKPDRVRKVLRECLLLVFIVGGLLGGAAIVFGRALLRIYTPDAAVIREGIVRLQLVGATYFLCGMMNVWNGQLRGMGHSFVPMIITLAGVCGFRIAWIYTVFPYVHTLFGLYLCWPISWLVACTALGIYCHFVSRKVLRRLGG